MNFSEIEKKNFFLIIPDIKMARKITYKNHIKKFLTPLHHLKKSF